MTTTTENWTIVNQAYADQSPLPTNHRREILTAIIECAEQNGYFVHASWVRPLLPAGVNEHLIGNVISQLSRAGILVKTGHYLPSNDAANRNATRDLPVRRITSWTRLLDEVTR